MNKNLRFAVIGIGSMGCNHLRVLSDTEGVDVVGICDKNDEQNKFCHHKFKVPYYSDANKLFDEAKPDCCVIAAPTVLHHSLSINAIERGIHVLVEKPISFTIEEAEEMIDKAKTQGVLLGVGHIERFNPAVIELKRKLDQGALGKIFMIHSKRQSPLPRRIVDVGVGMDLATHELDMMHFLTGSAVTSYSAEVSQVTKSDTREDIIFGLLKFGNGTLGILDVNWVTPTTVREMSITGEKGMFMVNYRSQDLYFYENPAAAQMNLKNWASERSFTVAAGNMTKFEISKREPLRSELEAFIQAVRIGEEPPVNGHDGLTALSLALRIVQDGQ